MQEMTRQEIIKAIETRYEVGYNCTECPLFSEDECNDKLMHDVLAFLKEQEAVEPYGMNAEKTYGICPKCGKIVFRYGNVEENHYCSICGQEVKWR